MGQRDVPLSAGVICQSKGLAQRFFNADLCDVFSSPLRCTLYTAMLASGRAQEDIRLIKNFKR
ncbi:MAG: hypothetical protein HQQ73_06835 [Desulfobulbaceae bacterium]|nr:hypothetical protein [Desulfobulbaceae bacterium]